MCRWFAEGRHLWSTRFCGQQDFVVNKITWQKAGRVAKPGRYMFTFGWLTVTADDLAVWERYPEASFTLVEVASDAEPPGEFRLGTFDLAASSSDHESSHQEF
jgi:hypothetical protein